MASSTEWKSSAGRRRSETSWAATTEFKVNYLKPVSEGTCRATANVEAMTKRSAVVSIRVENVTDDGTRLVALAQGTCTVKLAGERPG